MSKFHRLKTCTNNLEKYLPDTYRQIDHNTVAEMLQNEDYQHAIHTIQISTCNRFLSICFDTRKILLQFVKTEYLLADTPITFEPDYFDKIRISIENVPIKLPDKAWSQRILININYNYRKNILSWNKTFQQIFHNWNKSINASNSPNIYPDIYINLADTSVYATMTNPWTNLPSLPTSLTQTTLLIHRNYHET